MDWGFLAFLAAPWFVLPWYAIGVAGAVFVAHDLARVNTPLKQAMKWAWPIIVLFFSLLGLALYFGTARAPGISRMKRDEEKQQAHDALEENMFRRVNGAVIHCVAGDGLGIMSGMVIARATGMTFWQEFWFEYAVGFGFGLFIFQLKSMRRMTERTSKALWMAFRAEFFSMLTVMGGMGAVMAFVTPLVVSAQPKPLTYAFWGFGMLGLVAGYLFTFPMNWMLVRIGWKHGMGSMEGAHPVEKKAQKRGLLAAMVALGAVALLIPVSLYHVLLARPAVGEGEGLAATLEAAANELQQGHRSRATHAIDRALGTSKETAERAAQQQIQGAKHELAMGEPQAAQQKLLAAARAAR